MIDVSCAIISNEDGDVLVTQRSAIMRLPLKWEFPGGKVEQGERAEECLIREIREELNVTIQLQKRMEAVVHDYGHQQVRLIPFQAVITAGGMIQLTEHAAYAWLKVDELAGLDWAEADLPVLRDYLSGRQ